MTPDELVSAAQSLMQERDDLSIWRALLIARDDPSDAETLVAAVSAILTAAGITPAALGPDMIDQLIVWEKAQRIAVIAAPMQAATATLAAEEVAATQTAKPVTP